MYGDLERQVPPGGERGEGGGVRETGFGRNGGGVPGKSVGTKGGGEY